MILNFSTAAAAYILLLAGTSLATPVQNELPRDDVAHLHQPRVPAEELALEDVAHLYQPRTPTKELALEDVIHLYEPRAPGPAAPGPTWPPAVHRRFRRYVAIGDSYSAGPGRTKPDGTQGEAWDDPPTACNRTKGSWPAQLSDSLNPVSFQFSACTGAKTEEIIDNQITGRESKFNDPDLVTITGGGNNGDMFISVIKSCVVAVAPVLNCDKSLDKAEAYIRDTLGAELDKMIRTAGTHAVGRFTKRVVVVSGYPTLYAETIVPPVNCRLNLDDRKRIDSLSTAINAKIVETVNALHHERAGGSTYLYADPEHKPDSAGPDAITTFDGHRLCEAGVFNADSWIQGGKGGAGSWTDWKKGLFHPKYQGFTVMKNAAQYVLSTLN